MEQKSHCGAPLSWSQKNPYEEKAYRGPALKAVQTWWDQCKDWMQYFKGQSAPMVLDLHGLLQAFRCKEEGARAEVEAFMEHCAKRWQTKEGTYQLKRRRLLPDVRDTRLSKVTQILTGRTSELYMDGLEDYYLVEEMH